MRKKIIETITSVGLNVDDFIIGSGARDKGSEIHYRPNKDRLRENPGIKYSVQYCEDIVAIWEIGKRIEKKASVDMIWEGKCWRDIKDPLVKEIKIKGSVNGLTGFPHVHNHMLRHTFATRMREAGADIKATADIMGHHEVGITLNTYTDASEKFKMKEISLLESSGKNLAV